MAQNTVVVRFEPKVLPPRSVRLDFNRHFDMTVGRVRFSEVHHDGFRLTCGQFQFRWSAFETPRRADLPVGDSEIKLAGLNADGG